jgi:peptidoglycan/xylan/chitin deacetylase (PgdA/CDA1 family)
MSNVPVRRGLDHQRSHPQFCWPGRASVAVSLTFDVDAEAGLVGAGVDQSGCLSTFSECRYGITRGLQRILPLLADHKARSTFYVPGFTAQKYPEAVLAVQDAGHEIAHHGYLHRPPNRLDPELQREELERGTAILEAITGVTPKGYRAPSWELTGDTFRLLCDMGFGYDSSCMGDDWPYLERVGDRTLVELPVHWSLDDWPYYSWQSGKGLLSDPAVVGAVWLREFREALAERGHVTYTLHPEVSGRRSRFAALRELMEHMSSTGQVWFASHGEVARLLNVDIPTPQ